MKKKNQTKFRSFRHYKVPTHSTLFGVWYAKCQWILYFLQQQKKKHNECSKITNDKLRWIYSYSTLWNPICICLMLHLSLHIYASACSQWRDYFFDSLVIFRCSGIQFPHQNNNSFLFFADNANFNSKMYGISGKDFLFFSNSFYSVCNWDDEKYKMNRLLE